MWLSDQLGYSVRHTFNVLAVHAPAHSNICSFTSSIISTFNHWPGRLYTHLFIPPCSLNKGYHALKKRLVGIWSVSYNRSCYHSQTSTGDKYSTTCVVVFFWEKKKKNTRTMLLHSSQGKAPQSWRVPLSGEGGCFLHPGFVSVVEKWKKKKSPFTYFHSLLWLFSSLTAGGGEVGGGRAGWGCVPDDGEGIGREQGLS